ncbi:MAG: putative hydrolase YxeP [Gemmatimonadaceae bacterium]|nr:putative hydrolase YxeP [Gemmatimonadaceae bacterium]
MPPNAVTRARDSLEESERQALVALRAELHRHPELSWKEERTAARLLRALEGAGAVDVRRVAGTGVVGRIRGLHTNGPRVAIRGDIDALPIAEATGVPWASTVPGVMHACGHDVHATWAIGAAMLLRREPALGDVIVVLQPAEEVGGGAAAILRTDALDGVQAIFGAHVDKRFAVGQVVAESGPLAASADTFTIEVVGRGGHGARPHESADPIVGAAALVTALQTIVARRIDPAAAAVVTVGSIHGGSAPNVIPESVMLTGTLRAMLPSVRATLHDQVRTVATAIATAYGLTANVSLDFGTPPVVNPTREAEWAHRAAARILGDDAVVPFGITNMAGEDFAFYLEKFPGAFLRIGAREPGGDATPAHNPHFLPAEESIFVGSAVLAECARTAAEGIMRRRETAADGKTKEIA